MSTTTSTTTENAENAWERLEENRDVFETIVEQDGPWAPHAEDMLVALDERQEEEGDDADG